MSQKCKLLGKICTTGKKAHNRREDISQRECKKLMLREALIKASYELFSIKGFDETRVENITEKIDVSTHTFFRYFLSADESSVWQH
ncbi:TetR/AcrR family transcriptional regulator [Xenorhabdus bovienii]|uniref:TetR/AcrR family transcriptional regulator n=2 Tax=Xenorhabdus bovienii TaxID=40576 RepID=UPI0030B8D763|nr:TetR family transcriptional regulator [Xenorhabdus bovienii]MDE9485418.1 TetR family transcriptional regulator [Xenorhabdus bovienii]